VSNKLLIAALVAFVSIGSDCSRKREDAPAVATPAVSVNHQRAPLGSPVDVTYKFVVAQDAPKLGKNYHVFVHFLDSNEELMWTDDHVPPVPTSQWAPGQTIQYKRTVFIPIYPYVGDATVRIGLYAPDDRVRVPLAGDDNGQRAYKVATLNLMPQSENVFLIYKDGWHGAEVARDNVAVEWQWTKGHESTISFRNPKRDATIYLHLDGRPDLLPRPQKVTVSLGDQVLDSFELATREEVIRKIAVSAAQFGPRDMVDMKILVDETFIPAGLPAAKSPDARELGVRVFHAFVEPK
jgi:hypothetical protein